MANTFDEERTINALLYIIEKIGGRVDMHKAFKTLYFADRMHLSKYGRSITGDVYIAMQYGPVPSRTDDMLKAVRGDSFFSDTEQAKRIGEYFHFINRIIFTSNVKCDKDCLSESDIECLDNAIATTKDLSFEALTRASHDYAWNHTKLGREISVKDIMRENGETEEYTEYVVHEIELENAFCV